MLETAIVLGCWMSGVKQPVKLKTVSCFHSNPWSDHRMCKCHRWGLVSDTHRIASHWWSCKTQESKINESIRIAFLCQQMSTAISWNSACHSLTIGMIIIMVSNVCALQLWYVWWLAPPLAIDICWGLHGSNRTQALHFTGPDKFSNFDRPGAVKCSALARLCPDPFRLRMRLWENTVGVQMNQTTQGICQKQHDLCQFGADPSCLHSFSLWRISHQLVPSVKAKLSSFLLSWFDCTQ